MDYSDVLPGAAYGLKTVVTAIGPDRFTSPTPCEGCDVRRLANHLFYWAPVLRAAGRGEPAPTDRPAECETDLAGPDWPERVPVVVDEVVQAWSAPTAWQGTARYGSTDLPAGVAGSIVLVELVVHGWNFARGTGQDYPVDSAAADATLEILGWLGEQGRAMGAFGAAVPVPDSALALHRALGLSGRDPAWTPPST